MFTLLTFGDASATADMVKFKFELLII